MADVTFRYDRAPTGELSGESLVEQTEEALSGLGQSSSHAEEEAARAVEIVTDANAKSDQAVTAAGQAQTTANSALATAQSAQSTASQAVQTAQSAVTTAQGATQTAQNAVSVATSAQSAAQNAVTAAQTASNSAADAASAAGSSASSASAAQTAAEAAQTSAAQSLALATQAQAAAAASAASAAAAEAAARTAVSVIGAYMYFSGDAVPEHYLLCNGAAVSREDYSALFLVIGTKYGAGDGSTTFNLPNLIDKFIEGSGTSGTEKAAGLPNITGDRLNGWGQEARPGVVIMYNGSDYESGALYASTNKNAQNSEYFRGDGAVTANWHSQTISFDASLSNSIYGGSTTVQPPALTALPCIRYE